MNIMAMVRRKFDPLLTKTCAKTIFTFSFLVTLRWQSYFTNEFLTT